MAGVFFEGEDKREWNCLVDPVSTAIVYKNAPKHHVSIGLDVTMKCQLPAAAVRARFKPNPLEIVAKMAEVFFANAQTLTFHDPLAAATIFRPDLCTHVDGNISVSIDADDKKCGKTLFAAEQGGRHTVAKEVNAPAFFEEYFSVFA